MDHFIETVLNHRDLRIDHYMDDKGKTWYLGTSNRYKPFRARSRNPVQCLFKFNITLEDQKRLASYLPSPSLLR